MKSCTIIISHYESLPFLHRCVKQIQKHKHDEISQRIIICDQSKEPTGDIVFETYKSQPDIELVRIAPRYSGYGVDYCMRFMDIKTDYVAQLHVDAFPISDNWLFLPITIAEENNYSFVGQLQFISKPTDTIYYLKNMFFCMAQAFHVGRTDIYQLMSLEAGFTRFHERPKINIPMAFNNEDWTRWAKVDYKNRGTDDDVIAFCWQDNHREDDKLGLAITGYIEPSYGRIIEDTVFHFGSCREAMGVMNKMPEKYQYYYNKIQEDYSDALLEEMISLAKANRPPELEILSRNHWDGTNKISSQPTDELNNRIEELKNE